MPNTQHSIAYMLIIYLVTLLVDVVEVVSSIHLFSASLAVGGGDSSLYQNLHFYTPTLLNTSRFSQCSEKTCLMLFRNN